MIIITNNNSTKLGLIHPLTTKVQVMGKCYVIIYLDNLLETTAITNLKHLHLRFVFNVIGPYPL